MDIIPAEKPMNRRAGRAEVEESVYFTTAYSLENGDPFNPTLNHKQMLVVKSHLFPCSKDSFFTSWLISYKFTCVIVSLQSISSMLRYLENITFWLKGIQKTQRFKLVVN